MTQTLAPAPPRPAEVLVPVDDVLVAVKTPLMARAVKAVLPRGLTLAEAVGRLRGLADLRDPDTRRVLEQIDREISSRDYHFLVVSPAGGVVETPQDATLGSIATPREVRTPTGLRTVPSVAVEVQAYAPVGSQEPRCC